MRWHKKRSGCGTQCGTAPAPRTRPKPPVGSIIAPHALWIVTGHHGVILLVEDNDALREATVALLEAEGYTVVAASDGQEALDLLRGGVEPDLVVLDLVMPRNGAQFRAAQGRDSRLAQIPVIIISGEGNGARKAAALGIPSYLPKPTDDAADLLNLVARQCPKG